MATDDEPVEDLREFVACHDARSDSLLLGIFDAEGGAPRNLPRVCGYRASAAETPILNRVEGLR